MPKAPLSSCGHFEMRLTYVGLSIQKLWAFFKRYFIGDTLPLACFWSEEGMGRYYYIMTLLLPKGWLQNQSCLFRRFPPFSAFPTFRLSSSNWHQWPSAFTISSHHDHNQFVDDDDDPHLNAILHINGALKGDPKSSSWTSLPQSGCLNIKIIIIIKIKIITFSISVWQSWNVSIGFLSEPSRAVASGGTRFKGGRIS